MVGKRADPAPPSGCGVHSGEWALYLGWQHSSAGPIDGTWVSWPQEFEHERSGLIPHTTSAIWRYEQPTHPSVSEAGRRAVREVMIAGELFLPFTSYRTLES